MDGVYFKARIVLLSWPFRDWIRVNSPVLSAPVLPSLHYTSRR